MNREAVDMEHHELITKAKEHVARVAPLDSHALPLPIFHAFAFAK
jgi:hypothetical protein